MSSIEPVTQPTGRYSIKETTQLLGISRNTLKKYTDLGYIRCGFHKRTLKKFYTGLEITKFWRLQA